MFASRDIIISERIQAHQLIPRDNVRLFNKQKVNLSLCLLINARFQETFACGFYKIYYVSSLYKGIIDRVTGLIAYSNFCPKPMTCSAARPLDKKCPMVEVIGGVHGSLSGFGKGYARKPFRITANIRGRGEETRSSNTLALQERSL